MSDQLQLTVFLILRLSGETKREAAAFSFAAREKGLE